MGGTTIGRQPPLWRLWTCHLLGRVGTAFCRIIRYFSYRRTVLWRYRISRLVCFLIFLTMFDRCVTLLFFFYLGILLTFFRDLLLYEVFLFHFLTLFLLACRDFANIRAFRFNFSKERFIYRDFFAIFRSFLCREVINIRCRDMRIQRFSVRKRAQLSVYRVLRATRMFALYGRSQRTIFSRKLYLRVRFFLVGFQRLVIRSNERVNVLSFVKI